MFLGEKTENKKSTELSTDVITHKLKIKWEEPKFITKKMADKIFEQLTNKDLKTVTLINEKTSTYIQKYKTEIELISLDGENSDFEDFLYKYWLNERQKSEVREIWDLRKKEKKPRTNGVLKNIIEYVKDKY